MKKRILAYLAMIDKLLEHPPIAVNYEDEVKKHLVQIGFFQHERLIHLLVTLVFGILTVATVMVVALTGYIKLLVLAGGLLILLIPYIMHYYLLENEVQKMYGQYDEILKKL